MSPTEHVGYVEFDPGEDWFQETREEIAMRMAQRRPPPVAFTEEDAVRHIEAIRTKPLEKTDV